MRPVLFIPLFVLLSFPLLGRETREQALERKRALRRTTHARVRPQLSGEERSRLKMAKRLKDMDGTTPNRFEQEWAMHMNLPRGRAGSLAPSALGPTGVMTMGDIVVMEDDGSMVSEVPEFDLAGQGIRFVPSAQGGYDVSVIASNFDTDLGFPLLLDFGQDPGASFMDDGSSRVLFPQGFTFDYYGRAYSEMYVNANGNITFEQPDSTFQVSFLTFNTPFARIAPLFDDFNPDDGGGVFSKQLIDRLVITWNEVPEFFANNSTSFQAVLFRSGEIEFHYNGVEALLGKIGLTPGVRSSQQDFSAISSTTTIPGVDAIFDLFPTGFDLTSRSLTFTPAPGGGYQVASGASSIETGFTAEEQLDLLDDDARRIFFEGDFVFPMSGRPVKSFWVNSNGSVTVDFPDFVLPFPPDPLTLQFSLLGFGPRIAPLMADLDPGPEGGGQIYWRQLPDRVIVAWIDVVEFDTELPNTFQITAFSNGAVRFDYGTINLTLAVAAVVGDVPLENADWSAGRPSRFSAGACELFGSKPFDLNGRRITFTPNGSGHDVDVGLSSFEADLGAAIEFPINVPEGEDIDEDDDDATEVFFDAGFTFPFFGASFSSLFVSTNGHLTFNSPDPLSQGAAGSLFSDQPRIIGFGHDLNPTNQGGVFFRQLADRAILTWLNVPDFLFDALGFPDSNTFQVTLFDTGVITVDFIVIDQFEGVTGIAPGGGDVQLNLVDLNLETPLTNVAGIIGESFSFLRQVDIFRLTQKFYETHDDIFDFVILFSDFIYDLGGGFAFHIGVNNQVTGTGQDPFDRSEFFSAGPGLRSFVNMNSLLLYPDDPHALLAPGFDDNSYVSIMGQEAGHSWLAFVEVAHPLLEATDLLGRSLGHWSFFLNSDASVMEGNKWVETTPGNFTAIETVARFSLLDQYLMGLRSPSEVPNFFVIDNPFTDVFLPGSSPRRGTTLIGERVDVTVQNVIDANGPRLPAFPDAPRSFRGAFILLVRNGTAPSPENLAKLETFRAAWVSFFAQTTGARGQFRTGLTLPNAVDPATWSRLE